MVSLQLYGRVFIKGKISVKTGLHIGGSTGSFSIGGNDNPVIKQVLTNEPYIPGSSLRGKMRSLTEKYTGAQLKGRAPWRMHSVSNEEDYGNSPIANIYGVSAEGIGLPTRLVVRDVMLTPELRDKLLRARTDTLFTELKTEVSIDRITSQATPRPMERVPAGVDFGPMELVYSVYQAQDIDWFATLIDGMALVEDDYLGGGGSRGNGKIEFRDLTITIKGKDRYREPHELGSVATLAELSEALPTIQAHMRADMGL